jgi:hypothetical protein
MTAPARTLMLTRDSLHRLAEHVLSPARRAATGRIGLLPHTGGLRTPPFGRPATVVAVEGSDLVVRVGDGVRRTRATTLRAAGEFVGVVPGARPDLYPPATPCDLDAPLLLDVADMEELGSWYALGADSLTRWTVEIADDEPGEAQLWPEHLDLALSAKGVNYGFSPGDGSFPEPYAYVGPHDGPPVRDAFWNTTFGAVRLRSELAGPTAATAFFSTARERLAVGRTRQGAQP